MREALTIVLMFIGAVFMLLAAVGLIRMPDLFTRMQAATKGAALGAGCSLLGVAVYFGTLEITTRVLLIVAFIFLTAPVAAHMIARAAYVVGVPLWEGTVVDRLREHHISRRSNAADDAFLLHHRQTLEDEGRGSSTI